MKVSDNFYLHEFIDPYTYCKYGDKSIRFIDQRIIHIPQAIRNYFGKPVTINNWFLLNGGKEYPNDSDEFCHYFRNFYSHSGLRNFYSPGSRFSQHWFGRGIDIKVAGIEALEVQKRIDELFEKFKWTGLTRMEVGTPNHTHLDCAYTGSNELVTFNP